VPVTTERVVEIGADETEIVETGAVETGAVETGAVEAGVVETGADETGTDEVALVAKDEEDASWAQISPVTVKVVAASVVSQLSRTHGVAALVIADWFAASHWQAVSVALQEVEDAMAFKIHVVAQVGISAMVT